MKEYEDIFGTQTSDSANEEVVNNNVEDVEINQDDMVNESNLETNNVNTVFPNYSEAVEPVAPVSQEPVISEVNNVFGENVIETVQETVAPEVPVYNEPVEPVKPVELAEITENSNEVNNYNPMEHPDAKIVLKKEVEETKEIDPELEDVKIMKELVGNKSLLFVLGLGIVLLVVIFALPYLTKTFG